MSLKDQLPKLSPEEMEQQRNKNLETVLNKNKQIPVDNKDLENQNNSDEDKYVELLKTKFGINPDAISIDPKIANVAKSYVELQRFTSGLQNEKKEYENKMAYFDQLLETNPVLAEMIQKAIKGEKIEPQENIQAQKSVNQKDFTRSTSNTNIGSDDELSEEKLSELGFLNLKEKAYMTQEEWERSIIRAERKYNMEFLPKLIAEKAISETLKQTDEHKRKATLEEKANQIKTENETRYKNSFDRAIIRGFDPTGRDEKYLNEIHRRMRSYRDPKDIENLIREDAFERATEEVLKENGIELGKITSKNKESLDNLVDVNGFNYNVRTQDTKKMTLSEMLTSRRVEEYNKDIRNRGSLTSTPRK